MSSQNKLPFIIDPTYIPQSPSPNLLLCPTIDMPRKFTVSMFRVTLIMFKDIVESVKNQTKIKTLEIIDTRLI